MRQVGHRWRFDHVPPRYRCPKIFIYDGFEGGIGLAEKAVELIAEIFTVTRELVAECSCDVGCPACIYSPKCGNDNKPLDKQAAIVVLEQLANMASATYNR